MISKTYEKTLEACIESNLTGGVPSAETIKSARVRKRKCNQRDDFTRRREAGGKSDSLHRRAATVFGTRGSCPFLRNPKFGQSAAEPLERAGEHRATLAFAFDG